MTSRGCSAICDAMFAPRNRALCGRAFAREKRATRERLLVHMLLILHSLGFTFDSLHGESVAVRAQRANANDSQEDRHETC